MKSQIFISQLKYHVTILTNRPYMDRTNVKTQFENPKRRIMTALLYLPFPNLWLVVTQKMELTMLPPIVAPAPKIAALPSFLPNFLPFCSALLGS